MDNIPRQKLCEIISKYGRAICDDARRVEGLLRDLCGGYKRETSVLISALRERVPHELLNTSASITKAVVIARLSKKLHDELAMNEDAARWAVESWAVALGVITRMDIVRFATQQVIAVQSPPLNQAVTPPQNPPLNQTITPPQYPPFRGHDPNQSPEIRGFRLGMSLQEVLKHFNGLQVNPADDIGFQKVKLFIRGEDSKLINHSSGEGAFLGKRFSSVVEGLDSIMLEFLDGKVSSISLVYDDPVTWSSVDEFAKKISEVISLSRIWKSVSYNEKSLTTKTYWIYVKVFGLPILHLQDIQAEQTIKDRTAAKENHQRQTFKL